MHTLKFTSPNEALAADAGKAALALQPLMSAKTQRAGHIRLNAHSERREVRVEIPLEAMRLFLDLLNELAKGHAVTIMPAERELTTQETADILNVSRPYVVQLIESRKLPHRKVGTRRRIRFADVVAYKQRDGASRKKVADALAKEAEDLGLEY